MWRYYPMEADREFKSTFFAGFFSEPDNARELYNALKDTNYDKDTPIEITTIKDVYSKENKKNDVSFTIDNKFVIILEHQSTINNNMPIRCLMYVARVYEQIIKSRDALNEKLRKIPTPEFIVLYNGKRKFPSEQTLKLSDAYEVNEPNTKFGSLELIVKIININPGFNNNLMQKSKTLNAYTSFCEHVEIEQQNGYDKNEAVKRAVEWEKHKVFWVNL